MIWLGRILGKLSDNGAPKAIQRIEAGLETLTKLDTKPDVATAHLFLGECHAQRRQEAAAKRHLKKATALFTEMGMDYWMEEAGKIMKHFK